MAIEKQTSQIGATDIEALKAAVIREGKTIEYKQCVAISSDDQKRKFLASVASFANASGGDIIFGIKAEDGVPKEILPLKDFDPDRDIRTLRDIIRAHIDQPLFGIEFKEVPIDGGMVLVLRVPKGWGGAHMVTYNHDNRFYTRDANGRVLMNVPEIGSSFLQIKSLAEQIRYFRFERLSMIKSGEVAVSVADGAKWVLHLFPVRALSSGAPMRPSLVVNAMNFKPMVVRSGWRTAHDLDGTYAYEAIENGRSSGYSAVLRTGCVEVVQCFGGTQKLIPNPGLESSLMGAYASFGSLVIADRNAAASHRDGFPFGCQKPGAFIWI